MKMKRLGALIISLTMGMSLIACGGSGEQASSEEKKVVVYTAGPGGLAEGIAQAFEEETGVKMEIFQGTTGKIMSKLEAEKNNPVADVVVLASWPAALQMKENGMTVAYPEAKNADKLYEGWKDNDNHIFGYSGSALGVVYNTNLVQNPGKDWADYTTEEWKDKLNIPDPASSGSCMDLVSGFVSDTSTEGWNYFEKLRDNGIVVAGANKEALDPVITGAKSAVIAGVDYMAYDAKAKGEPIDIIYPESGTVINPRTVSILKDAPHSENAKLVVDFFLSDKAQELVKKANIIPGRQDIKCDNRANVEDIKELNYNWDEIVKKQNDNISKFQTIFNR